MTENLHDDDPRAAAIKADLESLEVEATKLTRQLVYKVAAVTGFVALILLLSWLVGRASRED